MAPEHKADPAGPLQTPPPAAPQPEPPAAPQPEPPPLPKWLVLTAWALMGLNGAVWVFGVARLAWMASANPPPLKLMAVPGIKSWTEKELYRARTGFVGRFLVERDGVWRVVARDPKHWEVVYWDFRKGEANRFPAKPDKSLKATSAQKGITLGPAIAAATRIRGGDLALVLHGYEPEGPVWLTRVKRSRLTHHRLPGIKPGSLVGFAVNAGHFEFVTWDCKFWLFTPPAPPTQRPLPGCKKAGRVVEWASRGPRGWRIAYSDPTALRTDGKDQRTLFMVDGPGKKARALGDLNGRGMDRAKWKERVDPTPGNVLPVGPFIWHTHVIRDGRLAVLSHPPKALFRKMPAARRLATQIILVGSGPKPNRRVWVWNAIKVASAGGRGKRGGRGRRGGHVITRWRWLFRMPKRWLAAETLGGRQGKRLLLAATNPDRKYALKLQRLPGLFTAVPAAGGGGGYWLFDSVGRHLSVNENLRRTRVPGFTDRVNRVLKGDHLQRTSVVIFRGKPVPRSWLEGLAHRWTMPIVLIMFPALLMVWGLGALQTRIRVSRRRKAGRLKRNSIVLMLAPAAAVLLLTGLLFYWFWQATAVF